MKISIKELQERRNKLFDKISNYSIAVIFAGNAKKCSYDEAYPFVVNKNFFYLTQVDQEDSVLLLVKTPSKQTEYLFIQKFDEVKEKWTGIRLKDSEARDISGIENIQYFENLNVKVDVLLRQLFKENPQISIYLDLEDELKIGPSISTKSIAQNIMDKYGDNIIVKNIYQDIVDLRAVKTRAEVDNLREAIAITNSGLKAVMNELSYDKREYQLAALFEYTIRDVGNCKTAFNTIAASGKNATILHYPEPNAPVEGELMLFDLGAQFEHYNADISRTYPINGKFSGIEEKLYDIVLQANQHVIDICRPGISIYELQEETKKILAHGLMKLGLIEKEEDVTKYYYHNVSHHIGLDTHDPISSQDKKTPLVVGNIISDEPGLYIKELGIGIRIEDDLLVTEHGCICLSADIAKEKADIEKLMASRIQK